jgi:cytochrome c oxidase cbb3-type subunit 3
MTETGPERDRLLGHDADGIEEYDNPLPGWWVGIFWLTIVFSVGYWGWYELGPGPSIHTAYEAEMRQAAEREARLAAAAGTPTEAALVALGRDAQRMAAARATFETRCAACHGPQGQGIIGPNLTDDYWIHGGGLLQVRAVIENGVPEKGMVPWKGALSPPEIDAVTAYVASLRGTAPPNPKPPQGTRVAAGGASR